MTLALLLACTPATPEPVEPAPPTEPEPTLPPELPTLPPVVETPSGAYLTPNPVEESMPIYGGTLIHSIMGLRSLDGHQKVGYGPTATLPIFNQLVMFDINYRECVPETIVGDLAESWEMSQDGTEITFKLRQGVKWHDGVPFTSNDVIYSMDKMNDVNRSVISEWFPAYESTEKIDNYTVKVHLKYPSAGFMLALAQGESQIQALHLAGTNDQSVDFGIGTGPFILEDYLTQVHLKYKRNPDYWKKDKYGNQLPYLDGITLHVMLSNAIQEAMIGRRLDLKGTVTGCARLDTYDYLKEGAPELLWQRRDRYNGYPIFINTSHPPLDDIRVRRAMGLVLSEKDLLIGFSGDVMFGLLDSGILHPAFGLPGEEVVKMMGWDKLMAERIAEAQQLMADAGYPDGFELDMLATTGSPANSNLVFAEALRKHLKIDANVHAGLGTIDMMKRLDEDNYDTYSWSLDVTNPGQLDTYFGTGNYSNWSKYSNPELDKMLAELDYILDPDERREAIWAIERILLTDLPALPTGCFPSNIMPYYPHVKNLRWNFISYSNINRLEDVWIDESCRVK
jgi:peptide/nickel transport system substrate-binding protein